MELPRRIMDGGAGAWEKSVISSASLDAPSPEFRLSLAKKLGVTLSAAGVATTTTGAAKAVSGALWLKWMGVGFAVGVVGLGAASYATAPTPEKVTVPSAALVLASAAPRATTRAVAPTLGETATPELTAPAPSSAEPTSAPHNLGASSAPLPSTAAATGPLGTASFAPPGQTELAAQTAAIQAVRASLAAHQASQALQQIDQYEHSYPAALFALEAEVLRIDAQSRLGSLATVKQLGERFLSAHPDSPYARHVRTLLEQGTNR